MTIRAMVTEHLDGWRWQWADFKENAEEYELFEQDKYDSFDEAHADLATSIRKHRPIGTLQGDGPKEGGKGASESKS